MHPVGMMKRIYFSYLLRAEASINIKLKFNEVLKRTVALKNQSPSKFKDLMEQFKDMSSGGTGGIYFLCYRQSTVRKQYYEEWTDKEFQQLVSDLENLTNE